MTLATLTCDDFAAHLGSIFRIEGDDQTFLPVTLVEASPAKYPGEHREPFTLVFRSASDQVLPQHLYAIDHDVIGRLEIFLVPLRRVEAGVEYAATFN